MRGLTEGLEIISTRHTKGNEYNRAFEIIKMSISSIEFQLKSNRVLCFVLFGIRQSDPKFDLEEQRTKDN